MIVSYPIVISSCYLGFGNIYVESVVEHELFGPVIHFNELGEGVGENGCVITVTSG